MRELFTEIEIDAPQALVWEILTDFGSYPEWNPFIKRLRADLRPGASVAFRVAAAGREVGLGARMLKVDAPNDFRWAGPSFRPLSVLVRGEHYFRLEPIDDARCRFLHGELWGGALLGLIWANLDTSGRRGFQAMNRALKDRAEKLYARQLERQRADVAQAS